MKERSTLKTENLTTGFMQRRKERSMLHEGLNLAFQTGELVCILGPNGAGKSTLIRTLLGFIAPLSGRIYYNNDELKNLTIKALAQLAAVVLTEKIDDIYLTAREIISTGRYPYGGFSGRLSDKDLEAVNSAEEKVGVEKLSGKVFTKLSDGEKQKVMIARAIAQDTPFIFLDEPVAYLDAPSRIVIMQLLKNISAAAGKGILMATHDIDSALAYADKLLLLGKNGNWQLGEPAELVSSGAINRYFDTENVKFDPQIKRFNWAENEK